MPGSNSSIPVGFVVHVMQMAGAERLVVETIRRLGSRIRPTVLCLDAQGSLGAELERDGIDVMVFGRKPGLDIGIAGRLAAAIRERQIHVVHAHQYTPFFYASLAKVRGGLRCRLVLTEHGRHYPDLVSARRRMGNRFVLARLADRINAVCAFSADALATKDGFPRDRIEIIPNGIDPAEYERAMPPAGGLPAGRRFITTIARFHPVKDHATLIRAFAKIAARFPDVDLLLAGDGPLRHDLESLATTLRVSDRVRFLGIRRDVPALLAASTIFALTSVSEGASLTVLEAMAAAKAIVLTDVGGNSELVRRDVDGLLAPRGDVGGIAEALARLLADPGLAAALGATAAARVRQDFPLDRTIERYYELYRALAPSRQ